MNKMRMYRLLKLIILCFALLIISIGSKVLVKADSSQQATIKLRVTNNGVPQINAVYSSNNLDTVYQKIISGDISKEDTLSSNWKNIQSKAQPDPSKTDSDVIQFSNGIAIGPGISHSAADALSTLTYILRMGGFPLLVELNGETDSILFHQPGKSRLSNNFTDKQGEAVALVQKGLNAIMTRDGSYQTLVNVSKNNQVITLDTANIDNRLSLSLEENSGVEKTTFDKYVVESGSGNLLTFKLKLSKGFNQNGGVFILSSTSNLIITSVEAPDSVDGFEVSSVEETGATSAVNPKRQLTIPPLSEDTTITIRAYVTPTSVKDAPTGGSRLEVQGTDDNGVDVSATSPAVVLAGANFVMTKSSGTELDTGGEYVLGKKQSDGYEIYSATNGWVTIQNFNDIDLSQVTVMRGGQQYSIGNPQSLPVPVTTSRFNFKSDINEKINQSLIQIIGLAQSKNYFLYPVNNTKGVLTYFSVFAKFKIGKNGELLTENSLGNAENQNFSINTTIPDFQTGVNEYNVLTDSENNLSVVKTWRQIILPIVLFCLLIGLIGLVLVKVV
ncbi:hypothetical protein [Lactococcus lactis]|uniref:hypothetical protein n=1 Tax=Lactococcus lactis TaxID=1358 RepID=UPI001780F12D|nr:hypothetical protein [Lactococcus lactis]MBD5854203.1 hypothetical protein [Lactococcus lactis]